MSKFPVSQAAPYLFILAVAGYLCFLTYGFDSPPQDGPMGPAIWPRTICILMIATCALKVMQLWFSPAIMHSSGEPSSDLPEARGEQQNPVNYEASNHERLDVWLGIGITALYLLALQTLGYLISTFLFLLTFIFFGRYRKLFSTLAVSTAGSLAFMYIFMKVVYISLPIGVPPFSHVSLFLMNLMNIR